MCLTDTKIVVCDITMCAVTENVIIFLIIYQDRPKDGLLYGHPLVRLTCKEKTIQLNKN